MRSLRTELSDRVHIVGFTQHAKFICHALSASGVPPAGIFTHRKASISRWGLEDRRLILRDGQGKLLSAQEAPRPEYIGYDVSPLRLQLEMQNPDYLDNIIVDIAPWAVSAALKNIRHRIDQQTTICLIFPGLGLVEKLIQEVFDDPSRRPNFILGHSTHKVYKHANHWSMRHVHAGRLLLYGVPRFEGSHLDPHALARIRHCVQLLTASDNLHAHGLHYASFLAQKLPGMVFSSLADTLSVILGCRHEGISKSTAAMCLWNGLLDETQAIMRALPEFEKHPRFTEHLTSKSFRRGLLVHLERQRGGYSRWVSWVRHGKQPPVDFINGYFVKRAQELGLSAHVNQSVMALVKARHRARRDELNEAIPFGLSPYMSDGDKIGGGQTDFDPELDDYDFGI
ncbi:hypothetical protein GGR56DRAFT_665738 [Xylariaceae sp. FL0804]|nr:hypothetical protein GGR56DRAFT_665738 [Xylariaceae sp. FL0804]